MQQTENLKIMGNIQEQATKMLRTIQSKKVFQDNQSLRVFHLLQFVF